jgi:hypothetical protein
MRKIEQLRWLTDDHPGVTWNMLVVDDGCPEGSGGIAEEILERRYDGHNVWVERLEDAIAAAHPATTGLHSPADSQKGGSILYGLSRLAETPHENHVVAFTDADLSTHLGQLALLAHAIVMEGAAAAVGSRREALSVVVKKGKRNTRGKLFIYLWKHMLPALAHIVDTQCGFKAFRADVARAIAVDSVEKRFAFDIELLVKVEKLERGGLAKVPVAWIDSEEASTTSDLQPYLSMLQSVAKISAAHAAQTETTRAFSNFVQDLTEKEWQSLIERIPEAIAECPAGDLGDLDTIGPEDLRTLLTAP